MIGVNAVTGSYGDSRATAGATTTELVLPNRSV
jgi:hypothetical protein